MDLIQRVKKELKLEEKCVKISFVVGLIALCCNTSEGPSCIDPWCREASSVEPFQAGSDFSALSWYVIGSVT